MAKISDEVKSFFVGDTTGLERAVGTGTRLLDTFNKKDRQAATEAKKLWESRAGAVKESLTNPMNAARSSADKLVQSMKLSALTTGVLGASVALAADKFSSLREEAESARKETLRFNEEFRKISQSDTYASHAEGSSSLIDRLGRNKDERLQIKDRYDDLHPQSPAAQNSLDTRYLLSYADPFHGDPLGQGRLALDRDTNKSQSDLNGKQYAMIQREIAQSLRDTVDLTKEQLRGGGEQVKIKELELARTREIKALQGTDANTAANQSAINERINLQVAKEKELAGLRDKQFDRDSRAAGISRQLVSDEQKRVNLLQNEAAGVSEQLRTRQFISDEEGQALQLRSAQLANDLRLAKGAAAVAESQFRLAQQTVQVQRGNTSAAAQLYKTQQNTLASLREQLAVEKDLNTTRARGLQLSIDQGENAVRLDRQNAGYEKTPSQIQQRINRDRKDEAGRDKFDKRSARDDGLINVQRDMSGNATLGLDPITGKWRKPASGMGKAEVGLHSGSLSDPASPVGGGASMIHDTDAGGGLHSGNTPKMFERSSAALALDKPTAASTFLSGHDGDPAHDPVARLAQASIWRNLSGGDRSTLAGARAAMNSTARMSGGMGGAFLAASAPKFNAPNTLSQAAIQLSAKKLQQEMATTEAVRRVEQAIQQLNIGFQ